MSMWKSNKQKGTAFENEVVSRLRANGYWVHFLAPDSRGAQPFDIIAMKDGMAVVGDCKTCEDKYFRMSRLEENQIYAFDRWLACGGTMPLVWIKHGDKIHTVEYEKLKKNGKVKLDG